MPSNRSLQDSVAAYWKVRESRQGNDDSSSPALNNRMGSRLRVDLSSRAITSEVANSFSEAVGVIPSQDRANADQREVGEADQHDTGGDTPDQHDTGPLLNFVAPDDNGDD